MRFENWPERLNDFLAENHQFDWHLNNCALFAGNAVLAITGNDFAAPYRGPKTKNGMISRLRKVGGGGVEEAATKELGDPLKTILMAKRGDVVSFDFGEGPALGICVGIKCAFISEKDGLIRIPLDHCRMAWSID